jgi:hypothetical protein
MTVALSEVVRTRGLFCTLSAIVPDNFHAPQAGGKVDLKRLTQLGRALQEFGVNKIPAYSPQARELGERSFGTWQGRCRRKCECAAFRTGKPFTGSCARNTCRLKDILAVPAAQKGTAFVQSARKDLDRVFSLQYERVVANDNTVAVDDRVFQLG